MRCTHRRIRERCTSVPTTESLGAAPSAKTHSRVSECQENKPQKGCALPQIPNGWPSENARTSCSIRLVHKLWRIFLERARLARISAGKERCYRLAEV